MSDLPGSPRPALSPFSFAVAGTFLLLVSAGYNYLASNFHYLETRRYYLEWPNWQEVLLPVMISALGCVAWWRGYRRVGLALLGVVAIVGLASMALQKAWGETLMHGTPQSIDRYARLTYGNDLLLFIGCLFDALACVILLWTARRNRYASPAEGG